LDGSARLVLVLRRPAFCGAVDDVADEVVEPGADDVAGAGPPEGLEEEPGCPVGLDEGLLDVPPGGVTRGLACRDWPCHERATDPPAGTFSEVTPVAEYFHSPDFPSDHHRDQYAFAGGVRGQVWSGAPSTWHTNGSPAT
jgi:hypothetical protein